MKCGGGKGRVKSEKSKVKSQKMVTDAKKKSNKMIINKLKEWISYEFLPFHF